MAGLFRGAALTAAALLAASSAPALAVVYTVTFGGAVSDNYVETTDGDGNVSRQNFTGGTFSAVFTFDTDLLPANAPDTSAGETFRYATDGGGWFSSTVTVTGGAVPAFGGTAQSNSLRGAFGVSGYVELEDVRLLREDANGSEGAILFIDGFDGLDAVPGSQFPDFLTAQNLRFRLSNSVFDTDGNATRYTFAGGDIGRVDVVTSAGAVPEPTSWATMALGFGLLGAAARRRRAAAAQA